MTDILEVQYIIDTPPSINNYMVGQKMRHFTFVHIFANYSPIFKIFLLMYSVDN